MTGNQKAQVEALVKKASEATDAAQAINYAQAACNAANALRVLDDIERAEKS